MVRYNICFQSSVRKDLKKINKEYVLIILRTISELALNPRPLGSKKLKGEELYRIRIGIYRLIYEIRDEELIISAVKVGYRSKVYKK